MGTTIKKKSGAKPKLKKTTDKPKLRQSVSDIYGRDAVETAISLYDGGWRPSDSAQMRKEYGMTVNERNNVVGAMKEMIKNGALKPPTTTKRR